MSLFGSSENKKESPQCSCNGPVKTFEADTGSVNAETGLISVKVLGSGCRNCRALFDNTCEALRAMGSRIEAEYITDMAVVASYGVMSVPALIINEKVVSMGKVYSAAEAEKLLRKFCE